MSLGALLLVSACVAGLADDPPPARAVYEGMAATAGRDPDAHAKLALWCEAHGLDAERAKHLGIAVVTNPAHALARGLMGLVQDGGKWRRPEQVVERHGQDPRRAALLDEYRAKRAAAGDTADAQAKLGDWCEAKGLAAESRAHYAMALRLDPKREAIWKKLGYTKHDGQWRTDEQVAAAKAEAKAQEEADRKWTKQLGQWKAMLGQAEGRRKEAQAGLASVDDPRAVPAILNTFAKDDPATAVRLLGQVDAAAASQSLAMAAVFASSEEVRRAAAETLTQRDPREFAGVLIPLIRDPIRYEVKPVRGPGSPGELWIEGKKADVKRVYAPPPVPQVPLQANDVLGVDEYGLPLIRRYYEVPTGLRRSLEPQLYRLWRGPVWDLAYNSIPSYYGPASDAFLQGVATNPALGAAGPALSQAFAASRPDPGVWPLYQYADELAFRNAQVQAFNMFQSLPRFARARPGINVIAEDEIRIGQAAVQAHQVAAGMQRQLEADVAQLRSYNGSVEAVNGRITPILAQVSGQTFGARRDAWERWYVDLLGYRLDNNPGYKPTVVQTVTAPLPLPVTTNISVPFGRSCFAAGTPVWTADGPRPIEALEVGDMVLAQDTSTGAQSYQPVLVVHRNPPSPTLKVAFEGGGSVTASTYHRFWKAGRGWAMARELRPGDVLRTQSGLATVEGIAEAPVQPVFNLDVAASHSFFVGANGALVHDNSLPDTRLEPFDRVPEVAAAAP